MSISYRFDHIHYIHNLYLSLSQNFLNQEDSSSSPSVKISLRPLIVEEIEPTSKVVNQEEWWIQSE